MSERENRVASLQAALVAAQRERDVAVTAFDDLFKQHLAEQQEAQHHLRNLMAVIRAIARRTAEEAEDVQAYAALLDGRMACYMHVHAAAAASRRQGIDLASLIAEELLRFGLQEGDQVRLVGPSIMLRLAAAGLLALGLHDLISRLVLAGLPDHPSFALRVQWRRVRGKGAEGLVIEWIESDGRNRDRAPSAWSDWIEDAFRHQIAGAVSCRVVAAGRQCCFRLPADCIFIGP